MSITVEEVETGISFGPFETTDCYPIEKSPAYQSLDDGIKIVEFAWLNSRNVLWLVEAKKSVPNPSKSPEAYERYFAQIEQKFVNSLTLLLMGCLNRHPDFHQELPQRFISMQWRTQKVELRLVIPTAPSEFLPQLQDKLRRVLARTITTWRLNPVRIKVINDQFARREALVK